MVEEKKSGEICSSCKHSTYCTYPKDQRRPVIQCNEFTGRRDFQVVIKAPLTNASSNEMIASTENDVKFKGLCKNCDNRKDCTFPKHEGGVWHCTEYI